MRNTSLFTLLLMLWYVSTASAQEVEFNIPSEINIVQGQLSVTFKPNVSLKDAQTLMESLGYPTSNESFPPLLVSATAKQLLDEAALQELKKDGRLIEVNHSSIPENTLSSVSGERVEDAPRFTLTFSFLSTVSKEEARALLKNLPITISIMDKKPNELIIDVGDQDAEAMTQLNGHEYIKWVTYLGVAGGE